MSILIKGMEMPKDCWHCRFADPEEGGCLVDQKTHGDWDEPDNCPLVPVPPHGRLIDADALYEKIPFGDIEHDTRISRCGAIADVCTWVLSAPTIIPAEEGE